MIMLYQKVFPIKSEDNKSCKKCQAFNKDLVSAKIKLEDARYVMTGQHMSMSIYIICGPKLDVNCTSPRCIADGKQKNRNTIL